MKMSRCMALSTTVLVAFFMAALARGETPAGASAHQNQIWGSVHTEDRSDLPAGKYVIQVDPGGSEYGGGERVVSYSGNGGSVNQDWTLYLGRGAIPSEE